MGDQEKVNELEKQMVDDIILKGYFEPDEVDSGEANATAEGVKEEDQGVKKEDLGVKEDQEKYQREEEERMQFLKEAELEEMKEKNPKEEEVNATAMSLIQAQLDALRRQVEESERRAQEAERQARDTHMRALEAESRAARQEEEIRWLRTPGSSRPSTPGAGTPGRLSYPATPLRGSPSPGGTPLIRGSPGGSPGIVDVGMLQQMHTSELERRCRQLEDSRAAAEAVMRKQERELSVKRQKLNVTIRRLSDEYTQMQEMLVTRNDEMDEAEHAKHVARAEDREQAILRANAAIATFEESLQAKRVHLECSLRKRDAEIANIRQLIDASTAAATPETAVLKELTSAKAEWEKEKMDRLKAEARASELEASYQEQLEELRAQIVMDSVRNQQSQNKKGSRSCSFGIGNIFGW